MKNVPKILLLAFAAYFLTGCVPIIEKIYGIKDPRIENEASIKKCALKYKLDTSNIVTVNGPDYLQFVKKKVFPGAEIFDAKGNYIEYKTRDSTCPGGLLQLIPSLSRESINNTFGFSFPGNTNTYKKTGKTNLLSELGKLRTLSGGNIPTIIDSQYDFYILIYWAAFIGRVNKMDVKKWEDLAKQNHKVKIKVININLDCQEYWDTNDKDSVMKMWMGRN